MPRSTYIHTSKCEQEMDYRVERVGEEVINGWKLNVLLRN